MTAPVVAAESDDLKDDLAELFARPLRRRELLSA